MKCYKCQEELHPIMDTAWRKHNDGTRTRKTEFICTECRVFVSLEVSDYANVDLGEIEE